MHRILTAAFIAAAAAAPAAAEGWYVRADAGIGLSGSLDSANEVAITPQFGGGRELEDDWVASFGAGRSFGSGLRVEGEFAYRNGDIEPSTRVAPGGEARAASALLNVAYDFNKGAWLEPYVGAGIGAARVEATAFNNAVLPADLVGFDDDDTALAYQLQAGVGVRLTDSLTLDLGYRYFAAPELEFDGRTALGAPRTFEADYEHQAATAGLRWSF